jgi:hypothetical protein
MSTVVGPLFTIGFQDGARLAYTPPTNTLDNRYAACTDHHPACDCREAEWSESMRERKAEDQMMREAFDRILTGHPAYGRSACMCTGCQIARAANLFVRTAARS